MSEPIREGLVPADPMFRDEEGGLINPPVPQQSATIVRAAPGDVAAAFSEYQQIQATLDKAMPDCIMQIGSKKFRKKNYWRGVAVAFNVTLSLVREQRVEEANYFLDEEKTKPDWGYIVTYRATAPNGRSVDGDGSCFASEKADGQDSTHNVRAHAHTRAKNRAVADLCGFGEVSAEEMPHQTTQPQKSPPERSSGSSGVISEARGKRLWAIAHSRSEEVGTSAEEIVRSVFADLDVKSTHEILRGFYETVITAIEKWAPKVVSDEGAPF